MLIDTQAVGRIEKSDYIRVVTVSQYSDIFNVFAQQVLRPEDSSRLGTATTLGSLLLRVPPKNAANATRCRRAFVAPSRIGMAVQAMYEY